MTKNDLNSDFENNRKAIEMEEKSPTEMPSRVEVHQSKKKSPQRTGLTLINVILILFTLIPIGIFVYVLSDLYNPKEGNTVSMEKTGVTLELGSKDPDTATGVAADQEDHEDQEDPEDQEDQGDQEQVKDQEDPSGPGSQPGAQPAEKKPEVEKDPAPQPEKKQPEQKPAPQQEPQSKPDTKPNPSPEQKPAARTHTVGPDETLYRISVNYYGSGEYVDKIKAANGLTTNSISVGQTLVIP